MALLVRANEWVNSRRLVDALWGERPPASATANLKTFVWELRRLLPPPRSGGDRIEARRGEYRLRADADEVDLSAIGDLVADARRADAAGDLAVAQEALGRAVELWRGDLADDLPDSEALAADRDRLAEERWAVLEDWFDVRLRSGQHTELVADIRGVLARRPLRERLWTQLLLALYRSGRRAEALSTYQEVYELLDRELGISPGPELQRLQRDILRDDPALGWSEPAGADPPPTPSPLAYLPPDLASFTGRTEELDSVLSAVLGTADDGRASATVCAIDGMAGIGKTTLAVRAAHRLVPRFPDGQLFLDLHGFTEGVPPVDPSDALDRLLRVLGVPGDMIPRDLEDRSALYRSRLADRRILVLLDNVADESQVLPLIPATAGCLVLVTGRRRLTGLDDVRSFSLDVLPLPDAVALFARIAGAQRSNREAALVEEVVELCGRLPLAIRIAAARLNARPTWTVTHLARRLEDGQHRLTELEAGQRSVVSALQVSYKHLTGDLQTMFRVLGLHPGPDIDTDAAAALADLTPRLADRMLEALVDVHLLEQVGYRRYRFHDLIRHHASALVVTEEPAHSRHEAVRRLVDHWISATEAAVDRMDPGRPSPPAQSPPVRGEQPRFDTVEQALDWLTAERRNLLAGIACADRHSMHRHVLRLAVAMDMFFYRRGYVDDWLVTSELALAAARHVGDGDCLSAALRSAANAHWTVGHNTEPLAYHEEALAIHRQSGDRRQVAGALVRIGYVLFRVGRYAESLERHQEALGLFQTLGDTRGEATALDAAGLLLWRLGRYPEAMEYLRQAFVLRTELVEPDGRADTLSFTALVHARLGHDADALAAGQEALTLYRTAGNQRGQTYALNLLGSVQGRLGRHAEAIQQLTQALTLGRKAGERRTEAHTLSLLGEVYRRMGNTAEALDYQERALLLARDAGDPSLECEVLNEMGVVRRAADAWEAAFDLHQHALKTADTIGDPYEQAQAHRGMAYVLWATGEPVAAEHHWQEALTRYTKLGVPEMAETEPLTLS